MPTYRTNLGKTGYLSYDQIQTPTNYSKHRPEGGLWMSRPDAVRTWENWCLTEDPNRLSKESAEITISDDARILRLDSDEKVQAFVTQYEVLQHHDSARIDYEQVMKQYDVVEFCMDNWKRTPKVFATLDVDSVLCLNPLVITHIHNPEYNQSLMPRMVSDFVYSVRPQDFIKENLSKEEFEQLEQKRQEKSNSKYIKKQREITTLDIRRRYEAIADVVNEARRFPSYATSMIINGLKNTNMALVVPPEVDTTKETPTILLCCKLDDNNKPILEGALQINVVLWQAEYTKTQLVAQNKKTKGKPDLMPFYEQAYIVDNDGNIKSQGIHEIAIDKEAMQKQYDALTTRLNEIKTDIKNGNHSWENKCAKIALTKQTQDLSAILQKTQDSVFDSNKALIPLSDKFIDVIQQAVHIQYDANLIRNREKISIDKYEELQEIKSKNQDSLKCQYLANLIKLPYTQANDINVSVFNQILATCNDILKDSNEKSNIAVLASLESTQHDIFEQIQSASSDVPFKSDKDVKGYVYEAYGKLLQTALDDLAHHTCEHAIEHPDRYYNSIQSLNTILNNAPKGFDPTAIMQKEDYLQDNNISQYALFCKHHYTPDQVKDIVMGTIAASESYQIIAQFTPDILMQPEITKESCVELCQTITNEYIAAYLCDDLVKSLHKYNNIDANIIVDGTQITLEPKQQSPDYSYKIECNIRDDMQYHLRLYHQNQDTGKWDFVSLPDEKAMNAFSNKQYEVATVLKDVQFICKYGIDRFLRENYLSKPSHKDRDDGIR